MGTFSYPGDEEMPSSPPTLPSPQSDIEMLDVDDIAGCLPGTLVASSDTSDTGDSPSLYWRTSEITPWGLGGSSPHNGMDVEIRTAINMGRVHRQRGDDDPLSPARKAVRWRLPLHGEPCLPNMRLAVAPRGILKVRRRIYHREPRTLSPQREVPVAPLQQAAVPGGMTVHITSTITAVFGAVKNYFAPPAPTPIEPVLLQTSTALLDARAAGRKRRAVEIDTSSSDQHTRRKRQKAATPTQPTEAQDTEAGDIPPVLPTAEMPATTTTTQRAEAGSTEAGDIPPVLPRRTTGEEAKEVRSKPRTYNGSPSFADEIRTRQAFAARFDAAQAYNKELAESKALRKRPRKLQLPTPPSSRPNSGDSSNAPAADFTAMELTQDPAQTQHATRPSPKETTKDTQIDDLIERTRKYRLAPTIPTAAQRQAAEDAAEQQAAAEQATREQAERDLAAQELAAQKLAAEKLAAEEQAARKAAAARKEHVVRDVPHTTFETIMGKLATRNTQKPISTVGPYTLTKEYYDRVLADENDTDSWLNDEVVNAWFHALCAAKNKQAGWQKSSGTTSPFACFNSAWFVAAKNSVNSVARWAKRAGFGGKKVLELERLFIPMNKGAHWSLLIINGTDRSIEYLCSFNASGDYFFNLARKWLAQELGADYHTREWTELRRDSNKSQTQDNSSDCGVFACFNGLAAAMNKNYKEVTYRKMLNARKMLAAVLYTGGFEGDYEL